MDVIFLVDGSFSLRDHLDFSTCMITSRNFKEELNFVISIVESLDIDSGLARVGFLQFATEVDHVQELHLAQAKALGKKGDRMTGGVGMTLMAEVVESGNKIA